MKRMDGAGEGSGESTGGGWRRGSVRRNDSSRGSNLNEDGSSGREMVPFEVPLLAQRVSLLHDGHERKLIGRHVFGCPHTYTYDDMKGGCLI